MFLRARLFLIMSLSVPWSSVLLGVSQAAPFSPLDFRVQLRHDFEAGRDVSARVREYRTRTGDHSFDSLESSSAGKVEAVKLQTAAWDAWISQDLVSAVRLYSRSYRIFLEEGAISEAGFCLYYIAEILSEQEKYVQALGVLERAFDSSRDCLYLTALMNESAGFCLWFLDRLRESTQAFSRASDCWLKLGYPDGLVGAWNNLAALHDELNLWERAAGFYDKALELEDSVQDPGIRFTLHANYASLLLQLGRQNEAKIQLDAARAFRQESPEEFLLIKAQVEGLDRSERALLEFRPEAVSLQIEKALLLGKLYTARDRGKALQILSLAVEQSARHGLRYQKRRCVAALGKLFESDRRYQEAAELYEQAFKQEENLYSPELLFPYSRVVSPLFDGWVRSIIESGDPHRALEGIHRLVALRRTKAQAVDPAIPPALAGRTGLEAFTSAARVEGARIEADWDDIAVDPEPGRFSSHEGSAQPVLVELWPDGDRIYAWVSNSKARFFRVLRLEASLNRALEPVLSTVFAAGTTLPPAPDKTSLSRLHRDIFEPLAPLLDSDCLVAVVHKELQNLPLEMLIDQKGRFVLESYNVSYLPLAASVRPTAARTPAPVIVFPATNPVLASTEREELLLRRLFPEARVLNKLDAALIGTPGWLHVSAHFGLDPDFWLASGFDVAEGRTNAFTLLPVTRSCALVSLGVCHAANAYSLNSPYWLGFSELFLSRGAGALLVSRWALDDLSLRIYRDFYTYCRQGLPMNEALTKARRRFLGFRLEREGVAVSGRHPYFWAGITYVGPPGRRLCPAAGGSWLCRVTLAGLLLVPVAIMIVGISVHTRKREAEIA
ncbi:MAG: CHAT domain-containing protein [Acidobacteriota bacterium]